MGKLDRAASNVERVASAAERLARVRIRPGLPSGTGRRADSEALRQIAELHRLRAADERQRRAEAIERARAERLRDRPERLASYGATRRFGHLGRR